MVKPFHKNLADHGLILQRGKTDTLQINVGRLCNLSCRHCHMEAGPGRSEVMDRETMEQVIRYAENHSFLTADITGGAPELVPDIELLITGLDAEVERIIMRTNLVLLLDERYRNLFELCRLRKVCLIASFPSTNEKQADAQRGAGTWQKSLQMLRRLNAVGYGMPGSDLPLFLVSNPAGAFLPADQCAAEKKFKSDLARKWDLHFTGLYTLANVPLGRFRNWLETSGNLEEYHAKLAAAFNPATLTGLMCRSQISVSWDGFLYDCDFNLAAGLPFSGNRIHISEMGASPEKEPIMTDNYCYACTAGAGFT